MRKSIIIALLLPISQLAYCQKTILWEVTDTIHNKTSFILGTFHQYGNSFVDSIPEIKENLYKSELAIFESIDKVGQVQKIINSRKESLGIKKGLKKKDYALLLKTSNNWEVNIHKLLPIELRLKLQQEFMKIKCKTVQKNDKWDHFDNYLKYLAEKENIKIIGLETDKEQINLISKEYNYPNWKDEKKRIGYLLDQLNRDDFNKNRCALATKYKNYDLDYKFIEECKINVLLKERNENWMKILPRLLREKNCFIAVGLFHLYNKCGLLEQLKNEGFMIKPIDLEPSGNNTSHKEH